MAKITIVVELDEVDPENLDLSKIFGDQDLIDSPGIPNRIHPLLRKLAQAEDGVGDATFAGNSEVAKRRFARTYTIRLSSLFKL